MWGQNGNNMNVHVIEHNRILGWKEIVGDGMQLGRNGLMGI